MPNIHLLPDEIVSIRLDINENNPSDFTTVEVSNMGGVIDAKVVVWLQESDKVDVVTLHQSFPTLTLSFANDECIILRDKDNGKDLFAIYSNGTMEAL